MTPSSVNSGERVEAVYFSDDRLSVDLADGRTITVPLDRGRIVRDVISPAADPSEWEALR